MTPPSHAETSDADSSNNSRRQGGALRVLVVGDSMTHGSEGDYTWRYRMHEWFTSQGILYQFVGPYAGTIKPPEPTPPEKPLLYNAVALNPPPNVGGGYAVGAGGTSLPHFAVSGRAAATNQNLIQNVVASYPADLMLINLGFNDLGWFYSDDNGLVNSMRNLINNARRANPNLKFVVATVEVHRTFIGGRPDLVAMTDHYNSMLKQAVGGWSTPSSPVIREEYNCGPSYSEQCPASYDGLHPNELGEYQIARGFTRGLVSGLGIGKVPLEVPGNIPTRLLPVPSNFQIATSDLGATATWDKVYGAYEYDVDYNINGGAPFNFSPGSVKSNRWDTRWASNGWTYQVRVRASAGNRKGGWTRWLMATARPKTASVGRTWYVRT
ncbi:SGNH hydrolase-type esterase domain-containing protein [Diaporthe sp. PMI_573]|nr:SGNH hydrolase-type esterase domain-containing protein [Diaporthaceae sp. PMI_573]